MVNEDKNKKPKIKWVRKKVAKVYALVFGGIVIAGGFLILGINIGNGNISLGSSSITGLPPDLNYSSVNQVYQAIRNNFYGHLTESQILNGIKEGMATATGDPYTEYFSPSQAKTFNNELNNSFSGIGAELSTNSKGVIQIIAPLSGTPAAKAGLQAKDLITSINGVSTSGMNIDQAVTKIRGKSGTKVTLGIQDGSKQFTVTITRANITVPTVNTKILKGNIGYMQITAFSNDTSSLAQKAAKQFVKEHVKGIVLDLRNDPGGLLTAAVNVSSLWLPSNQTILSERRGNTILQTYYSSGNDILHGIPTVVLINGGTASAAEITTGALHDHGDAYVIGTKSYGKGVVQQLINFANGSELKVTIASWYRPDGKNINKIGITPDKTVNLTSQEIAQNDDTQLNVALSYLSNK
jgi:carboxyl-terminal processing protease